MRCRCCDSEQAKWIYYWSEYYCDDCVDAISDTIAEDTDEEDLSDYA